MKKGFALLYTVIFLVLIAFIIGLIMINMASMSITVAKLPENYASIYGNQSIVSLGYMLIMNNQTATTLTYYGDTMYSATVTNQNTLPQGYTLYTVQGQYRIGQNTGTLTMYYLKNSSNNIYCVGWQ